MAPLLALFIGVLQGSTELFPVSSLGHAVLVPSIFHLDFRQSDPSFVPFLVLLHIGTASALLVIYRREWTEIIDGLVRAAVRGRLQTETERLAMLLMVGTIPTGVIAVIFEQRLKDLFATPRFAAAMLIVNGAILLGAELLRRRDERRARVAEASGEQREAAFARVEGLTFTTAILVGACQALALLPGISRSGTTMAAGLVAGLRHEEALRFSFLLATPIIFAAGVAEIPELFHSGVPIGTYLGATVLAALVAYATGRFLIRYFRVGRLDPFALYCALLGAVGLIVTR